MRTLVLAFFLAGSGGAAWAGKTYGPCPAIRFTGGEKIELSAMEAGLVCGDPATEGWGRIPFNQAENFLRAFLQQRGYQEPVFAPGLEVLTVDPGAKTRISSFTVTGLPPGIEPGKLRKIRGQVMTPGLLDAGKTALLSALQNRGYACPEIEMRGNGTTGEVSAEVRPGAIYRFEHISAARAPGVDPDIFYRYEAFRRGQRFDARLLDLTAKRAMSDSLFLNAYFDVNCSTGGVTIVERVVAGKSQLYKLGFGFDTEGLFIGRAKWQNSRIGARGNSMQTTLYASYREQSAIADYRYFKAPASRLYLMPKLTFGRLNEPQYESLHSELALLPGMSWDVETRRVELSAGPALEYVHTSRGLGPDNAFAAFQTQLVFRDHSFEYYAGDPREGGRAAFRSRSRVAGLYSRITAHLLSLNGEQVWNLGSYDPPALVLATRYLAQTTLVRKSLLAAGEIPLDMRFFMGGDANLRGAGLNKIPADSAGLLTAVYDGVELRMGDVLPHGLQPLVFLDAAMGGRNSFKLDPNVYWAPGFGFRWNSPAGSVRVTLARGYVWRRDRAAEVLVKPQWRFFLSLGTEF